MSNRNNNSVAFDVSCGIFTRVVHSGAGWCSYVEIHQKAPKGAPSWFFEECEYEDGDAFEEIVDLHQWHKGVTFNCVRGNPGTFVAVFGDDYCHYGDYCYSKEDVERDVLLKAEAVRDFIKSLR